MCCTLPLLAVRLFLDGTAQTGRLTALRNSKRASRSLVTDLSRSYLLRLQLQFNVYKLFLVLNCYPFMHSSLNWAKSTT